MLKLTHVSKKYGSQTILNDVSLNIKANEWLMLIGESGVGKSTLLKIIANEIPFEGKVKKQDEIFIAFSHQENDLLDECTVYENCILYKAQAFSEQQVLQLMEEAELKSIMHHKTSEISGGERQRASILRAILQKPDILLLDEPTAHLDDLSADKIMKLLKKVNASTTIIMVTHDTSLCKYASQVLQLSNGTLSEISPAKQTDLTAKSTEKTKRIFASKTYLKREMAAHWRMYLNMIISLSLGFVVLILSLNIGKHYAKELMETIDSAPESRQMTVQLLNTISDEELDGLLSSYKIRQLNSNYTLLDTDTPISINNTKVNVAYDNQYKILEEGNQFAISDSLARTLNISSGDEINICFNVVNDISEISGYRFAGPRIWYLPVFKEVSVNWNVDQIISDSDPVLYLNYEKLRELKSYSDLKNALKVDNFTAAFNNNEDFQKAKTVLLSMNANIVDAKKDIDNIQNGLNSQFLPFKYTAIFLALLLVITLYIILQQIIEKRKAQVKILKQLNLPNAHLRSLTLIRTAICFLTTYLLSAVGLLLAGWWMNTVFNPLDYVVLNETLSDMLGQYTFQMIHLDFTHFLRLAVYLFIAFAVICYCEYQISKK